MSFHNKELDSTQPFNRIKAKERVIIGGAVILACITLLSCFSSFMIYREGFKDTGWLFQNALSLFAVVVVEGAFVWLVYGFTRAFSSFWERAISFLAMWGLAVVMLTNIITHFMIVKGIPLSDFQQSWLAWGAVSIFIAVLVVVLAITLADPVIRLIRLELRYLGKQEETILKAKQNGLESEKVFEAMAKRAELEAEELAARIIGDHQPYLPTQPTVVRGFAVREGNQQLPPGKEDPNDKGR